MLSGTTTATLSAISNERIEPPKRRWSATASLRRTFAISEIVVYLVVDCLLSMFVRIIP